MARQRRGKANDKMVMLSSLWSSHKALFSLPVLLLVLIAALDSADKSLLAASFPVLERTLNLDVATLGYFSLFTNLSYALSLPFWGWLVHRYTIYQAHNVLSASCVAWGLATLGIAAFGGVVSQALFRSINGAALASILPLSQTMLVELVPASMRGRAFGLMGLMERAAGTIAVAAVVWFDDWRLPYIVVGLLSMAVALAAKNKLRIVRRTLNEDTKEEQKMTLRQIVQRIARIPAFVFLVGQGLFGGIPWDMMSFVLLLMEWKGFTKEQIVFLQFSSGVSGTLGGFLGGVLGDMLAHLSKGRIQVAFVSVVGGIGFFSLFLYSDSYNWSLVWFNLFHVWGCWTPAAAIRPICADLARNPSERAQIVAFWILLEKTAAAIFGAPLVGYLTKNMLDENHEAMSVSDKSQALTLNLFYLSSFFWGMCAVFWLVMGRALDLTESQGYGAVAEQKGEKCPA